MARYTLTDYAKADIKQIISYIRLRNPRAAKRVSAEIRSAMRRLADFPGMGHFREDVTEKPLRFWSIYSYLIIYRPETKPLQIIRVLHGGRDPGQILR
jgi:plasmid stabilization system protein ParE